MDIWGVGQDIRGPNERDIWLLLNKPFSGKVVVIGSDFRQILPIIPKASHAEIVMENVNSSILWKHCEVIELTKNMQLQSSLISADVNAMKLFAKWILDIGEGKVGHENNEQFEVEIPNDLLLPELEVLFHTLILI